MAASGNPEPQITPAEMPRWEDYARCVHCGLCLNHCPTYRLWGLEADSPRGRIRQMLLVNDGRMEAGASFVTHMDRCLDCRACETACPSGVEYGRLVEAARAQIESVYRRPAVARLLRRAVYHHLLPHPRRIAAAGAALRVYQRWGVQKLLRASGLLRLLRLNQADALLPPMDSEFFFSRLGKTFPAKGARRARVAFFAGCIAQAAFARLNEATVRVLTANGCEVVIPAGQVCCGALMVHAGERRAAREVARRNLKAFAGQGFDAVVTNAAGCGSTLKEYAHLFPPERAEETTQRGGHRSTDDPQGAEQAGNSVAGMAAAFASNVRDVTEFLAALGLTAPLRPVPLRVTVQDSCHLLHGQRVREAPRQLIRAVPGIELAEMPLADHCCGSAGVYNLTQPEASAALLAEKMECARQTGAQAIVTANPGCLLQLRAGAARHSTGQEVLHVIELLDRAL